MMMLSNPYIRVNNNMDNHKAGCASGMKTSVSVLVFLVIKVPSRGNWRVKREEKAVRSYVGYRKTSHLTSV